MDNRPSVFSASNRIETPVYPHDVFGLTDAGTAQIRTGGTALPAEALEVLVMLDGRRAVGDVEGKLAHLSAETVRNLIRSLLAAQLVRVMTMAELGDIDLDIGAFLKAAGGSGPSEGAEASAGREADAGAPALAREGYYVSIARRAVKAAPPSGDKRLALVVEDDPDMAALVRRTLEKAGFEIIVAANRDEVVARMRDPRKPDVVILDVMLPDVNGFDVLQRLKAHPVLKAIPVVMVTADAARESVVRGLASGADGYITKPFDPAALVPGVKAVLGI